MTAVRWLLRWFIFRKYQQLFFFSISLSASLIAYTLRLLRLRMIHGWQLSSISRICTAVFIHLYESSVFLPALRAKENKWISYYTSRKCDRVTNYAEWAVPYWQNTNFLTFSWVVYVIIFTHLWKTIVDVRWDGKKFQLGTRWDSDVHSTPDHCSLSPSVEYFKGTKNTSKLQHIGIQVWI